MNAAFQRLKIISSGQTGVDRAALDVALALGLPAGDGYPQGQLPVHRWDAVTDPQLPTLRVVQPGMALGRAPQAVLSNSFAFGGSNCALLFAAT